MIAAMADAAAPIAATTNRIPRAYRCGCVLAFETSSEHCPGEPPSPLFLALQVPKALDSAYALPPGPRARLKNNILDRQWSILVFGTNACLGASIYYSYTLNFGTRHPAIT